MATLCVQCRQCVSSVEIVTYTNKLMDSLFYFSIRFFLVLALASFSFDFVRFLSEIILNRYCTDVEEKHGVNLLIRSRFVADLFF